MKSVGVFLKEIFLRVIGASLDSAETPGTHHDTWLIYSICAVYFWRLPWGSQVFKKRSTWLYQ